MLLSISPGKTTSLKEFKIAIVVGFIGKNPSSTPKRGRPFRESENCFYKKMFCLKYGLTK
ncbi:hypothetical protein NQ314_020333 [Rhamnusium bicolor]|uniref:Uncharacterized protein n=1 Tax=Rhamnusium bicolor TaxID=1586634 RepID=A0AAV8WNG0_9CUCU|nr:hypothetical protein NQ314_020333 [Rhamnusium bicolor]